jgi:hypothetical protein
VDTPWILLHAAAVGRDDRILLLAGDGRAGKTTAAVACLRAGWDYGGDDSVLANTTTARIEALYSSARVRADIAPSFPDLINETTEVSHTGGELRYELRFSAKHGSAQIKGGALAAILLPRRRGAAFPEFTPARRFDAISALYTSMRFGQLGWHGHMVKKVAATVGLAPVFFVDTGQDPDAIPDAFAGFLESIPDATVTPGLAKC